MAATLASHALVVVFRCNFVNVKNLIIVFRNRWVIMVREKVKEALFMIRNV